MSGLNISCGDFLAAEKSGTPFERVLREMPDLSDEIRSEILAGFNDGDFTLIKSDMATNLIPHLRRYHELLTSEIGHEDFLHEIEREERLGICSVKLKWGEGRGWRLYCLVNLLVACEHSAKTGEAVVVFLD